VKDGTAAMNRANYRRKLRASFIVTFFLLAGTLCFSQSPEIDYNTYYRFPFSLGVEYQSLSPFATYGSQYNIFDIAAVLRRPIPSIPVLQPSVRAGMMRFTQQDPEAARNWSHTHWYGALGLTFSHRFARTFEIAGEVLAGFSEAVFPDLLPEEGPLGSPNLLLEAGARIALDPSYNFSIDVHPNLKYVLSLGDLKDFDGFIFGIGFSAGYRFGRDPDAAGEVIRSLRFQQVSMPAVFAAMQSYYVRNPLGTVTIINTESYPVTELEVEFFQPGYMDAATPAAAIAEIGPGESITIDLFASFNREVFATEGVTPLSGEVIARYKARGRPAEQRQSVTYDLHDKTAVIWDDDRKAAAFITPADSALRNYSSFIRQSCREQVIPMYSEALQYAVQVFQALYEIGCLYQADPSLPFTRVQGDPTVVDSISLPRETLSRITGDCDDLTVLFCSLLEAAGTETAFITVPGHIYAAFNTEVAARDYRSLHPERSMTINLDGKLWVPVEITMIGQTGFPEAWRKGVEQWRKHDNAPDERGFYRTRECQELYRPVGLRETDLGLQYGRKAAIIEGFQRDMDKIIEDVVEEHISAAGESGRAQDYNKLGIIYARFLRLGQAGRAFHDALRLDPGNLSAQVNVGNLLFLQGDHAGALSRYRDAYETLVQRDQGESLMALKVLLNISKAHYQLEQYEQARNNYSKAVEIDAQRAAEYAYLGSAGPGEARAAQEGISSGDILFLEEE
jgi:hypothetical protein